VRGVDTNILVRLLTRDDEKQFRLVKSLIGRSERGELFVNEIVLVELYWVLTRAYRLPRREVVTTIAELLQMKEITIANRELVQSALVEAHRGADFADALVALQNARCDCSTTLSFDREAATRIPDVELLA